MRQFTGRVSSGDPGYAQGTLVAFDLEMDSPGSAGQDAFVTRDAFYALAAGVEWIVGELHIGKLDQVQPAILQDPLGGALGFGVYLNEPRLRLLGFYPAMSGIGKGIGGGDVGFDVQDGGAIQEVCFGDVEFQAADRVQAHAAEPNWIGTVGASGCEDSHPVPAFGWDGGTYGWAPVRIVMKMEYYP